MFNSPLLDTIIGLVFVFLLYSLLATSIKEAIATLFGLRARMLKKGIVEGMLSDTPTDGRWISILKGIADYLLEIPRLLFYKPEKKETDKKLGDKFYDHPLIKNYGSNRIFPTPSYIAPDNFSTVLIDVLKNDFNDKLDTIAATKLIPAGGSADTVKQSLANSTDLDKIKELFAYYSKYYLDKKTNANAVTLPHPIIDEETLDILQMHLANSLNNLQAFAKKIEEWFDNSMDRVSGWYKRQVQAILFIIGLALAVSFNVDVIQITGKLTKDKDARDKIVQLAVQASDKYKDDPRVKKPVNAAGVPVTPPDSVVTSNDSIFKAYKAKIDEAQTLLNTDIKNADSVLAIGWGNPADHRCFVQKVFTGSKPFGFLLLAFAVCLGAPFWFDLLSKFVKLRATGKQESTNVDKGK